MLSCANPISLPSSGISEPSTPDAWNKEQRSKWQHTSLPSSTNHKQVDQTGRGEEADTEQLCPVFSSSHYPKLKLSAFVFSLFCFWRYEGLGLKFCQCLLQQDVVCARPGAKQVKTPYRKSKKQALTASLPITWLSLRFATVTPPELFQHLFKIHLICSQFWLSPFAHHSFIFLFFFFISPFPPQGQCIWTLPHSLPPRKGVCGNSQLTHLPWNISASAHPKPQKYPFATF